MGLLLEKNRVYTGQNNHFPVCFAQSFVTNFITSSFTGTFLMQGWRILNPRRLLIFPIFCRSCSCSFHFCSYITVQLKHNYLNDFPVGFFTGLTKLVSFYIALFFFLLFLHCSFVDRVWPMLAWMVFLQNLFRISYPSVLCLLLETSSFLFYNIAFSFHSLVDQVIIPIPLPENAFVSFGNLEVLFVFLLFCDSLTAFFIETGK